MNKGKKKAQVGKKSEKIQKKPHNLVNELRVALLKYETISFPKEELLEKYKKYFKDNFPNEGFIHEIEKTKIGYLSGSFYDILEKQTNREDRLQYYKNSIKRINFIIFSYLLVDDTILKAVWLYELMTELSQDFCSLTLMITEEREKGEKDNLFLLDLFDQYKTMIESFREEFINVIWQANGENNWSTHKNYSRAEDLCKFAPLLLFYWHKNFICIQNNYAQIKKITNKEIAIEACKEAERQYDSLLEKLPDILMKEGVKKEEIQAAKEEKIKKLSDEASRTQDLKCVLGIETLKDIEKQRYEEVSIEAEEMASIRQLAEMFFNEAKKLSPSEDDAQYSEIRKQYCIQINNPSKQVIFVDAFFDKVNDFFNSDFMKEINSVSCGEDAHEKKLKIIKTKQEIKYLHRPIVNASYFMCFKLFLADYIPVQMEKILFIYWINLMVCFNKSVLLYLDNDLSTKDAAHCYDTILFCQQLAQKCMASMEQRAVLHCISESAKKNVLTLPMDFLNIRAFFVDIHYLYACFLLQNHEIKEAEISLSLAWAELDKFKLELPTILSLSTHTDEEASVIIRMAEDSFQKKRNEIENIGPPSPQQKCHLFLQQFKKTFSAASVKNISSEFLESDRIAAIKNLITFQLQKIEFFIEHRNEEGGVSELLTEFQHTIFVLFKQIGGLSIDSRLELSPKAKELCEAWVRFFHYKEATIHDKMNEAFFSEQAAVFSKFISIYSKKEKSVKKTEIEEKKEKLETRKTEVPTVKVVKKDSVAVPYIGKKKKIKETKERKETKETKETKEIKETKEELEITQAEIKQDIAISDELEVEQKRKRKHRTNGGKKAAEKRLLEKLKEKDEKKEEKAEASEIPKSDEKELSDVLERLSIDEFPLLQIEDSTLLGQVKLELEIVEVMKKIEKVGAVFARGAIARRPYTNEVVKNVDLIVGASKEAVHSLFPYIQWNKTHSNVLTWGEGNYVYYLYVTSSKTLKEEAKRCDIAHNAFFISTKGEWFDPLNVYSKLKDPYIHLIGKADESFREDPSRILRLIRFTHQLRKENFLSGDVKSMKEHAFRLATIPWGVHVSKINALFMQSLDLAIFNLNFLEELGIMAYFYSENKIFIQLKMYDFWRAKLKEIHEVDGNKNIYKLLSLFLLPQILLRKVDEPKLDKAIELVLFELKQTFNFSEQIENSLFYELNDSYEKYQNDASMQWPLSLTYRYDAVRSQKPDDAARLSEGVSYRSKKGYY